MGSHPDKNRHDPVGAAESFRRLAAAYQRLTSAQHSTAHQAWEDLDVCEDVLTEEFFAEAFAQDIPPFELMYIASTMIIQDVSDKILKKYKVNHGNTEFVSAYLKKRGWPMKGSNKGEMLQREKSDRADTAFG
eukprot:441198-Pelagomonas_calceolata.AAC.2